MFLKRYKDDFISLPLTSNVCYFDEAINQFFLFIRYSCREAVIYSGFDKYSNDSVPLTQVYSFTIVLSRLPNNIHQWLVLLEVKRMRSLFYDRKIEPDYM